MNRNSRNLKILQMTPKEYLQQLQDFKTIIDLHEKKRQQLLYTAKSIQSPVYGVKVHTDRSTDQIPKLIAAADALELEKQDLQLRYTLFQNEVIDQIQTLDNPVELQILFGHYVQFKTLAVIAKEVQLDYSYIRAKHRNALQHFVECHPILKPFDF